MFRRALVSIALLYAAPAALAGPEAEQLVTTTANELTEGTLDLTDLRGAVDSPRIARFALGRHVRTLPDADVDRFVSAFEGFVASQFEEHGDSFAGARFELIGSQDRSERDSIVTTRMTLPGEPPETVRWRVIEVEGDWKIVDVQAYGLWLAIEQRAQIDAILGNGDGDIDRAIAALGDVGRDFAATGNAPRG